MNRLDISRSILMAQFIIFCGGKGHMPTCNRDVVPGGAGGAMAPPDFGRSVNPISTRGTDYANLITTGTPGFSDLPTALII